MEVDTPDSPLSDMRSDDFDEDVAHSVPSPSLSPEVEEPASRPVKRQRTAKGKRASNGQAPTSHAPFDAHEDNTLANLPSDAEISSDTEGSVPGSPHLAAQGGVPALDEEGEGPLGGKEQVSVCRWDGCEAGELGNMDLLVKHLHEEHIHARQKKYSCEWGDCTRKGIAHASGYALRAHMRSHTREKPFYCNLPECDRSFTRSDALAKHMRTVHETEALRPSDPVPKHHSSNPQNKSQRLRITFNKFSAGATPEHPESPVSSKAPPSPPLLSTVEGEWEYNNVTWSRHSTSGDWVASFPPDIYLTPKELDLSLPQLLGVLTKQIEWAAQSGEELRAEAEQLEKLRRSEWIAKELVLRDYLDEETLRAELEEAEALRKRFMEEPVEGGEDVVEDEEGEGEGEVEMDEADGDDEVMGGVEEATSHSNAIAVEEA